MRKYLLYLVILTSSLISCDNYLDVVPEKDIQTIESIFEQKTQAIKFFNGCYKNYNLAGAFKLDPAMTGADELVTNEYCRNKSFSTVFHFPGFRIAEGLQNPVSPIFSLTHRTNSDVNLYREIRCCNTVITNMHRVFNMSDKEKNKYIASAKAIKAYHYFQLMKRYGPITLVPKNLSAESDMAELQIKRSPVDTVVKEIVRLFDEAIPHLEFFSEQLTSEYGFFTKEAAYGFKAKVLLYAASPLFNGNEWYTNFKNKNGVSLFSGEYDPNKWKLAADAAKKAIDICESQGKHLVDNYAESSSQIVNTVRNIQNSVLPFQYNSPELIYGVYSMSTLDLMAKMPKLKGESYPTFDKPMGNVNPTMRMVEMFYTANGLPIDMDKDWNYATRYKKEIELRTEYKELIALNKEVIGLHLKREPRFYADIAFDRGIWLRGNYYMEMDPYFNGFNGEEEVIPNPDSKINLTGYWCKKFVDSKCALLGSKGINDMSHISPYPKMRLAELYLMYAEALNEFSGPSADVYKYMDKVRQRAGIPKVEIAWEQHAKTPNKIKTKEGLRDVIRQEINIEFAFEGHRFWNLRRWKTAHEEMTKPIKGWNIYGEDSKQFYNSYNGPIEVFRRNKFQAPRDYFWPFKDEEVLNANIVQNPGW